MGRYSIINISVNCAFHNKKTQFIHKAGPGDPFKEDHMKDEKEIIDHYKSLARSASYHYADDSGKEWDQAREYEQKALDLFYAYPQMERKLRAAHKGNLWSLPES